MRVPTIHVVPTFRAVTFAARMPSGDTLTIDGSRTLKIATGTPLAGLATELCSATISWFTASNPSTHTCHAPPTATVSHACVSGHRKLIRTTRCVRTTVFVAECRHALMNSAAPTAAPSDAVSVSNAPTPPTTMIDLVAGYSGGAADLNDPVPAGGNAMLSDTLNSADVSGNAGSVWRVNFATSE